MIIHDIRGVHSKHKNNLTSEDYTHCSNLRGVDLIGNRINSFPTTRYYGSKRRLITWIYNNLKNLSFSKVLDGFGGTASVSLLFKAMGKKVTFHDALFFNTVIGRALLSNYNPINNQYKVDKFFDLVQSRYGFISKTFKGIYYTEDENAWLDGIMASIEKVESVEERNVYLYCLFQACMKKRPFNLFHRANLYLRLNRSQERSFGNQTTWDTPFHVFAKQAYRELRDAIWNSGKNHRVLSPADVSELKAEYDLVYFDPPYISIKDWTDDYLKRYHFLEGLMHYKIWPSLIDHNCKTLSFYPKPHIREWQNKSKFKDRLFDLIALHKNSIVVLSYIMDAYPSKRDLLLYFKQRFSQVRVADHDLSHALTKEKRKELLIIGLP